MLPINSPPTRRLPPANEFLSLIPDFVTYLFSSEWERNVNQEKIFIKLNHQAGGSEYGFYYTNNRFCHHPGSYINGQGITLKSVEPSLQEDVKEFCKQRQLSHRNEHSLTQSLSVILPKCKTYQDVRDVLPEILHKATPYIYDLKRTREPGFLVQQYSLLKLHFERVVRISEYYAASKLLD